MCICIVDSISVENTFCQLYSFSFSKKLTFFTILAVTLTSYEA